jgi:hypothetical protein
MHADSEMATSNPLEYLKEVKYTLDKNNSSKNIFISIECYCKYILCSQFRELF